MTESTNINEALAAGNKVWLYEKPELLTVEDHGRLGLSKVGNPFEFARRARWLPLTVSEMISAQRHYPVVFTEMENPFPIAIVGIFGDRNLFVNEDGQWDPLAYLPAYLRCYPFALAKAGNDQLAVIVDRAAPTITEDADQPFFEDGKLTDHIQELVDFCGVYEQEKARTKQFCERLKELELLTVTTASYTAEGSEDAQPLATYVAVDTEKLGKLAADTLAELHKDGALAMIFAHVFSLENWRRLVGRHARMARTDGAD